MKKKSKQKAAAAPLSPYMLPTCDPPKAQPKAMKFIFALLAAWLLFLAAMASNKI